MKEDFTTPRLVIRPALPLDTQDVLEFTKYIWDGDDYIPYVWHDWLNDPEGELFVAEYAGHAAGLGRLTHLAPGQWWMEGLRADPKHHGHGIGSRMHNFLVARWLEYGDGFLRLVTTSTRPKVHHLCDRSGFTKKGEYSFFDAPALDEPDSFQPVHEKEISSAVEFAQRSASMSMQSGLVNIGWKYVTPNEKSLSEAVQKNLVCWWLEEQGLLTYWDDENPDGEKVFVIGMVACAADAIPDLLTDARRLSASRGYTSIAWLAPLHPELQQGLAAAGFKRDWDEEMYLYEKKHT